MGNYIVVNAFLLYIHEIYIQVHRHLFNQFLSDMTILKDTNFTEDICPKYN